MQCIQYCATDNIYCRSISYLIINGSLAFKKASEYQIFNVIKTLKPFKEMCKPCNIQQLSGVSAQKSMRISSTVKWRSSAQMLEPRVWLNYSESQKMQQLKIITLYSIHYLRIRTALAHLSLITPQIQSDSSATLGQCSIQRTQELKVYFILVW